MYNTWAGSVQNQTRPHENMLNFNIAIGMSMCVRSILQFINKSHNLKNEMQTTIYE